MNCLSSAFLALLAGLALPDSPDAILIEERLVADQRDVFRLSLGNQRPVERIPMGTRQLASAYQRLFPHSQFLRRERLEELRNNQQRTFECARHALLFDLADRD